MLQFEHFIARHGEIATQALIEKLERYEGTCAPDSLSLAERWQRLMQSDSSQQVLATWN